MKKVQRFMALILSAITLASLLTVPAAAETITPFQYLKTLSGPPIDKDGKQYDAEAAVTPGQTIYFLLPGDAGKMLGNDRNVRMTSRKTNNAKYINRIYLTDRILTSKKDATYTVPNGLTHKDYYTTNSVKANARNTYVAVELKDYTGFDEIRVDFDLNFTVRRDSNTGYGFRYGTGTSTRKPNTASAANVYNPWFIENTRFKSSGDRMTLTGQIYVANKSTNGYDTSVTVGGAGKTIKIAPADNNFISFDTNYDTIATLEFVGSSNPEDFIARLSTKWPSDLLSKFRDTDAVIWRFTEASIDCDSRAQLSLRNPFDEDSRINPKRVYIYSVDSRGILRDVTRNFIYDSDEDIYTTRTRTLGIYIISDQKVNTSSQ